MLLSEQQYDQDLQNEPNFYSIWPNMTQLMSQRSAEQPPKGTTPTGTLNSLFIRSEEAS